MDECQAPKAQEVLHPEICTHQDFETRHRVFGAQREGEPDDPLFALTLQTRCVACHSMMQWMLGDTACSDDQQTIRLIGRLGLPDQSQQNEGYDALQNEPDTEESPPQAFLDYVLTQKGFALLVVGVELELVPGLTVDKASQQVFVRSATGEPQPWDPITNPMLMAPLLHDRIAHGWEFLRYGDEGRGVLVVSHTERSLAFCRAWERGRSINSLDESVGLTFFRALCATKTFEMLKENSALFRDILVRLHAYV